jgi:hypothetical protein
METAQLKATFKDTYGAISNTFYSGLSSGSLSANCTNAYSYFMSNLNTTKQCPGDSSAQGCWDTSSQGTAGGNSTRPGFVMHNGTNVIGLHSWNCDVWPYITLNVDLNGVKGPNTYPQDQFVFVLCFTSTCDGAMAGPPFWSGAHKAGAVGPYYNEAVEFNTMLQ